MGKLQREKQRLLAVRDPVYAERVEEPCLESHFEREK
jgi:hypothetical protein